jgi:hypothetical protein
VLLAEAVARGNTTTATARRGLGGFEAAWREYAKCLEQRSEAG